MKIKVNFVEEFRKIIQSKYNDNYISRKRNEITYFEEILYVINSHNYWSSYRGDINKKVLYNKHIEYIKKGYYEELFKNILNKYISYSSYFIYKFQSTDTSFVPNKLGVKLPRNKFYKNKKGIKISSIVDSNGIPLSLLIENCNHYDSTLLGNIINSMYIDTYPLKYKQSNRHKQYFLADKGYDSNENINLLEAKGYDVIIPQNKRNIKDASKLRVYSKSKKMIYKKRILIENSFGWIKNTPKLLYMFEKKKEHYKQLILIVYSQLIFNRFIS